jgi:hypothetical protein
MKEEFGKLYGTSYRTYFSYFDNEILKISYYHSNRNSIKSDRGSNCNEIYKTVKDEIDKIYMDIPQEVKVQKQEAIQDKIKYIYKDDLENELKKNGKYFVDEIELYEAFIKKDYKQILKEKKKKK